MTTEELVKQLEQRDRDLQSADALVYDFGRFTEEQTRLLAAGLVPNVVRAQALAMLSFDDLLERNAARTEERRRAPRTKWGDGGFNPTIQERRGKER